MQAGDILQLILSGIGGLLIAVGLALMVGGALGLLRFPDFYTRLHAINVSDLIGAVTIIVGLAFASGDWGMASRLLLLAALFAALGPTLGQLLANAAHAGGLAPLAGRYTAPRPGARRGGAP